MYREPLMMNWMFWQVPAAKFHEVWAGFYDYYQVTYAVA
jgi:hypothetical protein